MLASMDEAARQTRSQAEKLAIEQERASLALAAAGLGEFEWRMADDTIMVSPRMAEITGVPAGRMPAQQGRVLFRYVHPEDVEDLADRVAASLRETGRFEVEFRIVRPDNGYVLWVYCAGAAPRGAERVIGVVRDVTQRRNEDEARDGLIAELDHRVKNVLASVQSLAAQSARKTTSLDAFLKTFAGRLEAMASAHTLLTATRWRGAEIGNIAAAELGGLAPGQARWSGPEIVLNPRATNALTLALHELATNAVKFGALSAETGRVEVKWTARPEGGFELTWTERGGPPVAQPSRRGFGATLLERVTGRELGGEAKIDFVTAGVRATVRADRSALAGSVSELRPLARTRARAAEPEIAAASGASSGVLSADSVQGRKIIIVEDAMLLSLELEAGLTEAGACVVGAAADLDEAMKLLDAPFDVAVLDANLNGTPVTPVAEALRALGKRFIFATGYGDAAPAPEGFDAPVVRKPYNVAQIAAAVAEALRG
jgi:PAS domain S-box-containing protein